ncbi:HAD family hydrolase [Micromonospora endolithica]|nr:HAD hydrolase-like protein [Micromonospora endolithica]TWJ24743.1 phosphoglycolate phosphatase/pyrophosphatase PpaX [Micromonospora endolithica]
MLYDLDGVIVDSRALVAAALSDVATNVLGRRPEPDAVTEVIHLPPVQALGVLGVTDPIEAFDDGFDDAYATHAGEAALVPGIVQVMRRLHLQGVRQAVVTLQRRHRLALLNLGDVATLMDTFVTFEDAKPKPAPDPVLTALARLDVAPRAAWFVGDTVTDIIAGHAAGVRVAAAAWGYSTAEVLQQAGADVVLTDPTQITTVALTEVAVAVSYDGTASGS